MGHLNRYVLIFDQADDQDSATVSNELNVDI